MAKRKPAIFKGHNLYCPDCGKVLLVQFDTQADEEESTCWSCGECALWFTVGGEPAIHGTGVPESEEES